MTVTISAVMVDANGVVSGNGAINSNSFSCPHTVTGTRSGKDFSIVMTCTGYQPISFEGAVTGNELNGNVNGSGFVDMALLMIKQ